MKRTRTAELPMKGLFALQGRALAFTALVPLGTWLLPWPTPLRLLGLALPPLFLVGGLVTIASVRCPACGKILMHKGLSLLPRRKCPHCRETVA